MFRYVTVASALKLFSTNDLTKKVYRYLGNTMGANRRAHAGLPRAYLERAREILAQVRKHDILKPGDRVLELGTGWVHWEATVLRLFYSVQVELFDVWDNRQFKVFQGYVAELATVMDREIPISQAEMVCVHRLLGMLAKANSFADVYAMLGYRYIVDSNGTLDIFPDNHFKLIVSSSVLEHVKKELIASVIDGCYRMLAPGGYCIHLIDLSDHLAHYDKNVSLKNYLRYPDATWRILFQNDVQYFNRVQRPEWHDYFERAGFVLVEEHRNTVDLAGVRIAPVYAGLTTDDLACLAMHVVYRKPNGCV